jgi:hypothetical protein
LKRDKERKQYLEAVETLEGEYKYLEKYEKELLLATAELKTLAKTDESILNLSKECIQEALDLYSNYQKLVTKQMKTLEEKSETSILEIGKKLEVKSNSIQFDHLNGIFLIFYDRIWFCF